jgi:hypothetical protein
LFSSVATTSTERRPSGVTKLKTQTRVPSLNDAGPKAAGWRASMGPSQATNSPAALHSMARTAFGPTSKMKRLTVKIPGATKRRQRTMRKTQGSATVNNTTQQTNASQTNQTAAPNRDGMSSIRPE